MKISKRIRTLLVCIFVMAMLLPGNAFAQGKINTDEDVSLTIAYAIDNKAVADVEFDLYYVAEVTPYAEFVLNGAFADYAVEIGDDWDNKDWDNFALTLTGMAQADNLVPMASGKTDQNGKLLFSSDDHDMKPGLYLVVGKNYIEDKFVYKPSSFMVSLPVRDAEENDWDYSVTVSPKAEVAKRDDLIERKVLKIWKDTGYSSNRPEQIQVQLLQDGVPYGDAVTLNAANEWRYEWTELKPEHDWTIVELNVPKPYTVSVARTGVTFTVVNSITPPPDDDDDEPETTPTQPPTEPTTPPPTTPEPTESLPVDEIGDNGGNGSNDPGFDPFGVLGAFDEFGNPIGLLPATGTSWWMVPILAGAGVLLFAAGFYRSRKYGKNEEN